VTDGAGVPLAVQTGPANVPDGQVALGTLDRVPPLPGARGPARRRPRWLLGDAAYGSAANRAGCRGRGVVPVLARPRQEHGSGRGELRYVVERTLAWFGSYRRLKVCYERHGEHFQAFHELAAALICANKLRDTG
jgi:transposase